MTKRKFSLLLFFFLALLFWARVALADTGPKPTMEFTFYQPEGAQPLTITSGTLYECHQADCKDAAPLQEGGPQRFTCEAESCHALAYGFTPYHKLRVQFSDGKTRESNPFATAGFEAKYSVMVRSEDLIVDVETSAVPSFSTILLICLCLVVIGGLMIGLMIFFLRRRPKN